MKKIFLPTLTSMIFCLSVHSQNEEKQGDLYITEGDYASAAIMYYKGIENNDSCLIKYFNLVINEEIAHEVSNHLYTLLHPKAQQGNTNAQFYLGYMYFYGYGIKRDILKAEEWLLKSAEKEDSFAQVYLGFIYYFSYNNYPQAFEYFQKSAKNENALGQEYLGYMYENGDGVKQSHTEALKWFLKSAEQGNTESQYKVGEMYNYGYGVEKNKDIAIEWYKKAAIHGNHSFAVIKLELLGIDISEKQ